MKTLAAYLSLFLVLSLAISCGTSRKSIQNSPVIPPLENPADIAASEARAREVMDSIERRQGVKPSDETKKKEADKAPEQPKALSEQIIAYARQFTGVPYKLGASGPKQFDCSGFTRYVFKHFGYDIPQYSGAQFQLGKVVKSYSNLQKGDLVFFGKRGSVRDIGHVGILVSIDRESGSFNFIHASVSGGVVESNSSQPYYHMRYMGARRILPDEE